MIVNDIGPTVALVRGTIKESMVRDIYRPIIIIMIFLLKDLTLYKAL